MTVLSKLRRCVSFEQVTTLLGSTCAIVIAAALIGCDDKRDYSSPRASQPAPIVEDLIPFSVINRDELGSIKVSYEIRVDLVDGRPPNEEELAAISRYLHAKERPHERTFVAFLLPGMRVNAGAYATAHHTPEMQVRILGTEQVPDGPWDDEEDARIFAASSAGLRDYSNIVEVRTRVISPQALEVTVATLLPLPAYAKIEVGPHGHAVGDPWFGVEKSVQINESPFTVIIDAEAESKLLPIAEYQATVVIKPAKAPNGGAPKAEDRHIFVAAVGPMGSGLTPAQMSRQKDLRRWIAENVKIGTAWRSADFTDRLGEFEEISIDGDSRPAVYFADADATLILDEARGSVVSFRFGR